jgi:protein transport protein SEC24
MALPAVDCDKAFAMQMILEESLLTMQTAYLQAALLYPFIIGHIQFVLLKN